jgi:peroxiredoxin
MMLIKIIAGVILPVLFFSIGLPGCISISEVTQPVTTAPVESETPEKVDTSARLKAGDIAPDFTLPDVSGRVVSLRDYRGSKVVINMWWMRCHGCIDEMPYLQEFYHKWGYRGMELLAINVYDPAAMVQAFAESEKLTFMLLLDPQEKLNQIYINSGVPTTFFADAAGVIRAIKDGAFLNTTEIDDMFNSY